MAKQATNLESELQKILDGLGDLPGIVGKLGDVVARLAASLTPLHNAIQRLMSLGSTQTANPAATAQALNNASTDRNTVATSRLTASIEHLIASINKTAMPVLPRANPVAPGGTGGGGEEVAGMLSRVAAIAGVAAAAIAVFVVGINLAEREFQKIVGLVKLFNPGIVQMFQFALDNLGATIGRAFVPVIQVATSVVREWTAALAPVIQSLVPILQQFSDAFGNLLAGALRNLASVLQSMLPMLSQWFEVLQLSATMMNAFLQPVMLAVRALGLFTRVLFEATGLGVIVRVLTRVFEAFSKTFEVVEAAFSILEVTVTSLVDSLMMLLGSLFPFKDIMDSLTRAVQFAIRNLYVFSILLAKFLGLDGVADALIKSIEDKTKQGDTAAQSPQIKTLEQLSKDLALAAASAGGAAGQGGVRNQQEFWQKTLDEMKQARANGGSMVDFLREIRDLLRKLNPIAAAPPPAGPAQAGVGGVPAPQASGGIGMQDIAGAILNPFLAGRLAGKALGFN